MAYNSLSETAFYLTGPRNNSPLSRNTRLRFLASPNVFRIKESDSPEITTIYLVIQYLNKFKIHLSTKPLPPVPFHFSKLFFKIYKAVGGWSSWPYLHQIICRGTVTTPWRLYSHFYHPMLLMLIPGN